jgi:peptidoglycan/xylan/chitin deacetylase (PgdA/CDA1 family)
MPDRVIMYNGHKDSKSVALTFDDGPFPENTEKILRILRKQDIKATFFMHGKAIEQNRESCIKVIAEGHEIGKHLYNHSHVTRLSYEALNEEMKGWGEAFRRTTLSNGFPKLFRPPYGSLDMKTLWYSWRKGWTIVLWSLNSNDLSDTSLKDNIDELDHMPMKGGDIILLHEDSKKIEGLLEWIIRKARSKGYTFSKVSEFTV